MQTRGCVCACVRVVRVCLVSQEDESVALMSLQSGSSGVHARQATTLHRLLSLAHAPLCRYLDAHPERPSLETLLDEYWRLMPEYQGVQLDDLQVR